MKPLVWEEYLSHTLLRGVVVGETFGVCKTTIHHCVYAVCQAIRVKLMSRDIKLPDQAEHNK